MKAHIGVDEFSGLMHQVKCTAANVSDVTVAYELLHGKEGCVTAAILVSTNGPRLKAAKRLSWVEKVPRNTHAAAISIKQCIDWRRFPEHHQIPFRAQLNCSPVKC